MTAIRALRKNPGFTLIAILTLAVGIGANTTMFSVANGVLLRPLPGVETDRVVQLVNTSHDGLGYVDQDAFREIRKQSQSYEQLAALQFCQMNLTAMGEPRQLIGPCMTANWFDLQKEGAMLGRTFAPGEDQPGRSHVVVLDHGFWLRRFGGDKSVVGRTITLDKAPWQIIGVMPPGFKVYGVTTPDFYTPYVMEEHPGTGVYVAGRLKRGVTLEQARAEARVITSRLPQVNPDWKNIALDPVPVIERVTGADRRLLLLLLGAVSLVLLVACGNVANLLLARGTSRRQEIAIRIALGATPSNIAGMVLREALVLSIAASLCAVAIAYAGLYLLKPLTDGLSRADELSVDGRVLGCAIALGAVTALLFGLIPALRAAGFRSRSTAAWQHGLLAGEVALAFVLLLGAGLLLRTFAAARSVNLGYEPRHVLTNFLSVPPDAEGKRVQGTALYGRIRQSIAALPGVVGVATTTAMPMGGVLVTMDVQPEGQPARRNERRAALAIVSESYFLMLGIPVRDGRSFTAADRAGATPVAIVSESVAKRHFGGRAVGRRIILPEIGFNLTGEREIPVEIVGVTGNVCVNSVSDCEAEHIYLPETQSSIRMTYILVRTTGNPMSVAENVRRAVFTESPSTPLDDGRTLEDRTSYLTDAIRRGMWLLGLFAGVALILAALGVYGVTAYVAAQRTREVGIRMALGADFGAIVTLLFQGSLRAAAIGLTAGCALAASLARFVEGMLYGVRATDPFTISVVAGALLMAVAAATLGPALRAAWIDPARILHRD